MSSAHGLLARASARVSKAALPAPGQLRQAARLLGAEDAGLLERAAGQLEHADREEARGHARHAAAARLVAGRALGRRYGGRGLAELIRLAGEAQARLASRPQMGSSAAGHVAPGVAVTLLGPAPRSHAGRTPLRPARPAVPPIRRPLPVP
jgi:hypothetical protein